MIRWVGRYQGRWVGTVHSGQFKLRSGEELSQIIKAKLCSSQTILRLTPLDKFGGDYEKDVDKFGEDCKKDVNEFGEDYEKDVDKFGEEHEKENNLEKENVTMDSQTL